MRRLTPLLLLSGIGGSLVLAVGASGCHAQHAVAAEAAPPPGEVWLTTADVAGSKVEIAPVGERELDTTLVTSSRVQFDDLRVSHIFSPVNGRVTRIDAKPGQQVKKGDRLAVIESPDVGSYVADERKANADLVAADHDYKRQQELALHNGTTEAQLEQSQDAYRKALAELERARAKTFLLRAGGGGGGYDGVSQTYTITSPIDGEIFSRALNPGIEVQGMYGNGGGLPVELFTVGVIDRVWILSDVYETDVQRVKVGSKVRVTCVAYRDKTFDGQVEWVSGVLDPSTRTAKVRVALANPDRLLKPEMYATAFITVAGRSAIAVPRTAILPLGDQSVVFVSVGRTPDGKERFERTPVTVDDVPGDWVAVTHGLDAGVKVVTVGASALNAKL
jgi:cobalt-zinc-cadmium efflux system membrane fusion protein